MKGGGCSPKYISFMKEREGGRGSGKGGEMGKGGRGEGGGKDKVVGVVGRRVGVSERGRVLLNVSRL